MKPFKSIYILVTFLAMASCSSYFDPEGLNPEEKLVLYCMPNVTQDTIVIQLSKSVPVNKNETPQLGIKGADISFMVNGVGQPVYWNEARTENLPPECYYVLNSFNTGDNIEIMAASKGLKAVASSTSIPTPFPTNKIDMVLKPGLSSAQLQFRITYKDDVTSDDYYGVRIEEKIFNEYEYKDENGQLSDTTSVIFGSLGLDIADEPLLNDRVGLDATFELDYDYFDNLYIWTDEQIQGKEYTMRLTVPYTPDRDSSKDDDKGNNDIYISNPNLNLESYKISRFYKVTLYHLSPELYRYLKSMNDIANNDLGQSGFAPIRNHYTNILNGFGVFGGCQYSESSWLPNP